MVEINTQNGFCFEWNYEFYSAQFDSKHNVVADDRSFILFLLLFD